MKKTQESIDQARRHLQAGQVAEAKRLLAALDRKLGTQVEVIGLLGIITGNQGDYAACAGYFKRAAALQPGEVEHWYYLGMAYQKLLRHADAIAAFDRALTLEPDLFAALHDRANSLRETGRLTEAIADFDRAIALDATHFTLFYNRGITHGRMKRYREEIADYARSLALNPRHAGTHINLAVACALDGEAAAALTHIDRALALEPGNAAAWAVRGDLHFDRNRFEQALEHYRRALAIDPQQPHALFSAGTVHYRLKQTEDAATCFRQLVAIAPDYPFAVGQLAHLEALACNWNAVDKLVPKIIRAVEQRKKAVSPFFLLSMSDRPDLHRIAAEIQTDESFPAREPLAAGAAHAHARTRIAYVSNDFHEHATAMLMVGLLEQHDRARYEICAISYGPDDGSALRRRVEAAVESFIDVSAKTDREIAVMMREMEIDIAIDLKGFTTGSRLGIFAFRPAPVQVSYLGYPGTTAAPYIDFILADATVITPENRAHFSEKVACLPHAYQPNDDRRAIPARTPSRAECGMPEQGIVFASFNNSYKLSRSTFALWLDILHSVPASVLWLLKTSDTQQQAIVAAALESGIDPERIVFAPRVGPAENLARLRLADLCLDNLPYNAHTSASDALWAGVPLLTIPGVSFASRVGMSLLEAVGLPEMVCADAAAFKAAAIAYATAPETLADLKQRLAANRTTAPLFDTRRFARHVESAYDEMLRQHASGEGLADFTISAS